MNGGNEQNGWKLTLGPKTLALVFTIALGLFGFAYSRITENASQAGKANAERLSMQRQLNAARDDRKGLGLLTAELRARLDERSALVISLHDKIDALTLKYSELAAQFEECLKP